MEIAVFPIPDLVALPGQTHKIHVFEPRYREMMLDCFKHNRMVGLALPLKAISDAPDIKPASSVNQNLGLYKAAPVMGAGTPKLLQTLEDGRQLVRIDIACRVRVREISQYLPYYLAKVVVIPDLCGDPKTAEQLVDSILELAGVILTKEISVGGPIAGVIQHRIKAVVLWVCSWFDLNATDRQHLIELPTAVHQARFLVSRLSEFARLHGLISPVAERRPIRRYDNVIEVDFR